MAAPTITNYLKYARLQMAAEAFIRDEDTHILRGSGQGLIDTLKDGNKHTSRFPESEAKQFADNWEVLDQRANTKTGFSGTLFRRVRDDPTTGAQAGELVLSFRSTEFIDDAVRDNEATNVKEIRDTGWAFGQISDLEDWYAELRRDPGKLQGQRFAVTGYSLGGHLATAFHLLHPDDVREVVTFNGAGVGRVKRGTLADGLRAALATFNTLRRDPEQIAFAFSASPAVADLYREIHAHLADQTWTLAQASDAVRSHTLSDPLASDAARAAYSDEKKRLARALTDMIALRADLDRVAGYTSGGDGEEVGKSPKPVPAADIAALDLDYRLALAFAAEQTVSASILGGALRAIGKKTDDAPLFANQFDLVGRETTTAEWSAVAHSQWHHGSDVGLFIEDQPFARGDYLSLVTQESLAARDFKGLVDRYAVNDFGDNHSLVLIVDSLAVQHTILPLLPAEQRATAAATLETVLRQASWHQAKRVSGTPGEAEGDVLENVVNALADLFLGPQPRAARLRGSLEGNTFARTTGTADHSGREALYARLDEITGSEAYRTLTGKLTLASADDSLTRRARDDFTAFAALSTLSPIVFAASDPEAAATALGKVWGDAYADWVADRAALAAGSDRQRLAISDAWVNDRTDFLQRGLWFHTGNLNPEQERLDATRDVSPYQLDSTFFSDAGLSYRIAQGFSAENPPASVRRTVFGDGEADVLAGGGSDDHLYGGAGNDTLDGSGNADWLEGNAGADRLDGGDGRDTLIGGPGDDTLIGGDGEDLYVIHRDDGNDHLVDSGRNFIQYEGQLVAGVLVKGDGASAYTFVGDNGWTMSFHSPGVLSFNETTSLTFDNFSSVEAFASSEFGLGLQSLPPRAIRGTPALEELKGDLGDEVIEGDEGREIIQGLWGNDSLWAETRISDPAAWYASLNEAGDGQPGSWLQGGLGDDLLVGSHGNDVLRGGAGNDELTGEGGHDWLDGEAGNDVLYGDGGGGDYRGALPDHLAGNDTLDGGAGDDTLIGSTATIAPMPLSACLATTGSPAATATICSMATPSRRVRPRLSISVASTTTRSTVAPARETSDRRSTVSACFSKEQRSTPPPVGSHWRAEQTEKDKRLAGAPHEIGAPAPAPASARARRAACQSAISLLDNPPVVDYCAHQHALYVRGSACSDRRSHSNKLQ